MVEKSGVKSSGSIASKLANIMALRKKVPKFRRQEAHRRKRLTKSGWRAPRGAQSKLRRYHKSKGALVRVGYRLPKVLRGLHKSGKEPISVATISELENLDKAKQIIIISANVGMRKRVEIVKQAIKLGLEIQNIDAKTYEASVKKKLDARQAKRKSRKAKKVKKAKKAEKKKEGKKAEAKKEVEKMADKITEGAKKAEKVASAPSEKKVVKKEVKTTTPKAKSTIKPAAKPATKKVAKPKAPKSKITIPKASGNSKEAKK